MSGSAVTWRMCSGRHQRDELTASPFCGCPSPPTAFTPPTDQKHAKQRAVDEIRFRPRLARALPPGTPSQDSGPSFYDTMLHPRPPSASRYVMVFGRLGTSSTPAQKMRKSHISGGGIVRPPWVGLCCVLAESAAALPAASGISDRCEGTLLWSSLFAMDDRHRHRPIPRLANCCRPRRAHRRLMTHARPT